MGSFCGTNSQTVINQPSNPNITNQQNNIYKAVNSIVDQYKTAPSSLVAPWNPIQTAAVEGIADHATSNLPANQAGLNLVGQGAATAGTAPSYYGQAETQLGAMAPIQGTGWNPTPYMSPYTQNVIDATMANINQTNQIQQNGALGNAISQGNAFGGDRAGVAMGELARNQALASNQTMAQLQQAAFNQASQQANAQQQYDLNLGMAQNAQALQAANAYSGLGGSMTQSGLAQGNLGMQMGQLGQQGQAGALSGLGALFNAGTALQGTQQQQRSAPLTLAAWMAQNSPAVGATPTSTTYPGSSPLGTIAGLGLSAASLAGMLSNLGGSNSTSGGFFNEGGRVNRDMGGQVGGDMVSRFQQFQQMLQPGAAPAQKNNGGGMAGIGGSRVYDDPISGNVVKSDNTAVTQGYNLARQPGIDRNMEDGNALLKMLSYVSAQRNPTSAARGGRQGYADGSAVLEFDESNNDPGNFSLAPDNGSDPSSASGPASPMRLGAGPMPRNPYADMERPESRYEAAQKSPWMAGLVAGLGMLANAGARDARGLPIPAAAQLGKGALEGTNYMQAQWERAAKQRDAALRARQLEAQWEYQQAQLRQQLSESARQASQFQQTHGLAQRQVTHAEGAEARQEHMARLQNQLNIDLARAKSKIEQDELFERARAMGLVLPNQTSGRQPADTQPERPLILQGDPRFSQGAPTAPQQQAAAPASTVAARAPSDQYLQLTQPSVTPEQEAEERRRRAATAAITGDIKGAAKILNKEEDPKEYQTKDAAFAERMARSEITLRGVLGENNSKYNPADWLRSKMPDWNLTNSAEWRNYQASAREWISAMLRKDTGAAVTESEWAIYFPTYFPQPGDGPDEQRQKMDRRVQAARGLRNSAGPAFPRMYPNFDAEMRERLRDQDPQKYGAPGSTPQVTEGKTATNPSTGQRIIFRNGQWQPL